MTATGELEALKARVKELEAAQSRAFRGRGWYRAALVLRRVGELASVAAVVLVVAYIPAAAIWLFFHVIDLYDKLLGVTP